MRVRPGKAKSRRSPAQPAPPTPHATSSARRSPLLKLLRQVSPRLVVARGDKAAPFVWLGLLSTALTPGFGVSVAWPALVALVWLEAEDLKVEVVQIDRNASRCLIRRAYLAILVAGTYAIGMAL